MNSVNRFGPTANNTVGGHVREINWDAHVWLPLSQSYVQICSLAKARPSSIKLQWGNLTTPEEETGLCERQNCNILHGHGPLPSTTEPRALLYRDSNLWLHPTEVEGYAFEYMCGGTNNSKSLIGSKAQRIRLPRIVCVCKCVMNVK